MTLKLPQTIKPAEAAEAYPVENMQQRRAGTKVNDSAPAASFPHQCLTCKHAPR